MDITRSIPKFSDVLAAYEQIRLEIIQTPVLHDTPLDQTTGGKVFLKCENVQRGGAFKFRGAWNTASQLTDIQISKGIITYSSGNHAQAVAICGELLRTKTTIVMPKNAPAVKRAATEDCGAEIVIYDPKYERREDLARKLINTNDYTLVPPFDHPHIVAGQGTAALELFNTVGDLDVLLVPCGGGGLLAGSALAANACSPGCRVIGVEPKFADDAMRSFRSGQIERISNPDTIADGARTEALGEIPFTVIRKLVADIVTVPEQAIIDAVKYAFFQLKQVVEPTGALGIAALLSQEVSSNGRVGVLISGGNIDPEIMTMCLS